MLANISAQWVLDIFSVNIVSQYFSTYAVYALEFIWQCYKCSLFDHEILSAIICGQAGDLDFFVDTLLVTIHC